VRLGVHVSIGKGFKGAITQAITLGCDGFQIFAGNPRGWARKLLPESEFSEFVTCRKQTNLWPVVVHLAYLPNPATEDKDLYEKSVLTMAEDFRRANQLGADFFVFHPGKSPDRTAGIERVVNTVNLILEQIAGPTLLLFESQAGGGKEIGGNFEDLGLLLAGVKQSGRVGVCLDTCHSFAAGYDLRTGPGWEKTIGDFQRYIGLSFLKMFHLNDSVGVLGSHLDRHQHIGEGEIGLEGFKYLINHPTLNKLPGILETPQDSAEDDLRNLGRLRG
jgi:deoxyribonuclease IV